MAKETKKMDTTAEIALVSSIDTGHLAPTVEFGKTLTSRDHRISVTIFITESPFDTKLNPFTQSILSNKPPPRMQFVLLIIDQPTPDHSLSKFSRIKDMYLSDPSRRLKGFVLDMFCTAFADVASELGVPCYMFYTSNCCSLSLMSHLQLLHDHQNKDLTEFKGSGVALLTTGLVNPVPANVFPSVAFDKDIWSGFFVHIPRTIRKCKGILVNTFSALESYTIERLSELEAFPPIYAVGPVLNLKTGVEKSSSGGKGEEIMTWLDNQPPESVVFLCFGSLGTFEAEQVVEIARALEQIGRPFLWALRRPPSKDDTKTDTKTRSEYDDFGDILPEGFLDRTKEVGKVTGWTPQVAVLSHQAVGGFVSHCGWNSILESLWCGVPIATWPLYAEQQMNAFELVKELGLAVEITLDYHMDDPITLGAEEIKRGIMKLMEGTESTKLKSKVKAMSGEIRRAAVEGGSSYAAVGQFIEEVLNNN